MKDSNPALCLEHAREARRQQAACRDSLRKLLVRAAQHIHITQRAFSALIHVAIQRLGLIQVNTRRIYEKYLMRTRRLDA